MIIGNTEKLVEIETQGDKTIFKHLSDNTELLEYCAEMRDKFDPHFKTEKQRPFWPVATIPNLQALKFLVRDPKTGAVETDSKALEKWLQSDEGRPYRTSRTNLR